jgi:hypothetical protein
MSPMLRSIIVVALLASSAFAQRPSPPRKPPDKTPPTKPEPPRHDMDAMDIAAKNRKLTFMMFLERASEELERAALVKRSFIPEIVRTVDAEQL